MATTIVLILIVVGSVLGLHSGKLRATQRTATRLCFTFDRIGR